MSNIIIGIIVQESISSKISSLVESLNLILSLISLHDIFICCLAFLYTLLFNHFVKSYSSLSFSFICIGIIKLPTRKIMSANSFYSLVSVI